MHISSDYNIVVVGMGFIGGFLLPGYEMLLGDKVATNVFGVKATDRNLEELRERLPFSISVDNTAELLRETTPDIVIMCPPPKQIPVVAREILLPYFNEAREKGISLPDIYTFGPSPDPKFYYELLGDDINCVKYLPSMAEPFKGVPLQECGGSFLTFGSDDHPFPEERRQRAIDFSNMFGRTFIVPHDVSLIGLSAKNTSHTCYEICYAVSDVMAERGYDVSTSQVGSAMRAAMRKHLELEGEGLYPSSLEDVPEEIRDFIEKLSIAWFEGILKYVVSTGCDIEMAREFHAANFEVWNLTAQLATREELEISTANHATKGGVNEKAIEVFMGYFDSQLKDALRSHLDGTLPVSFFDTAEGMAFAINLTVNRHAHRLANR
ncbi:MAG: hypothetical protein GX329_08490 [Tissierellia bacterium]|nr:hypothetical protein [Tissierellia bacterium]